MLELGVRLVHHRHNNSNHHQTTTTTGVVAHNNVSNSNNVIGNGHNMIINGNLNNNNNSNNNNNNTIMIMHPNGNQASTVKQTMFANQRNSFATGDQCRRTSPESIVISTNNNNNSNIMNHGNIISQNGNLAHTKFGHVKLHNVPPVCPSANYTSKLSYHQPVVKPLQANPCHANNGANGPSTICKSTTKVIKRVPLLAQLSADQAPLIFSTNTNLALFDRRDERRRLKDYRITSWPASIGVFGRNCSVDTPTTSLSSASTTPTNMTASSPSAASATSSRCITPTTPPVVTSTTRSSSASSPIVDGHESEPLPTNSSDLNHARTSLPFVPESSPITASVTTPVSVSDTTTGIIDSQKPRNRQRHHHNRRRQTNSDHINRWCRRDGHRKSHRRHRMPTTDVPVQILDDEDLEKYDDLMSRLRPLHFGKPTRISGKTANNNLSDGHTSVRDVCHVTGATMFIRIDFLQRIEPHRKRTKSLKHKRHQAKKSTTKRKDKIKTKNTKSKAKSKAARKSHGEPVV